LSLIKYFFVVLEDNSLLFFFLFQVKKQLFLGNKLKNICLMKIQFISVMI